MDQKYIKVLKHLNEHSNQKVDISPVLLEFFPSDQVIDSLSYSKSKQSLFILLNNMQNEGLIEYIHPNIGGGNETNGFSWIHKVPIHASITIKGQTALNSGRSKILGKLIDNFWAIVVGIIITILGAMIISKFKL